MIGRDRSGAGWSDRPTRPGDLGGSATPVDPDARYIDVELVGAGGMGTVMIARDARLGREVAVKRVAADPDDVDAAARLAREASITARLEHPSIVPIYDAGLDPAGRAYYAMRLIRGRSLAEVIADTATLEARLSLVRAFLAMCQAMAYAHRHGVLHRDLKPANVMIGEFDEVYLVDWGLARELVEPEPADETLAGTPAYLAPERARGEVSTTASDVWSLGAILGEIVLGRGLMPASRLALLAQLAAPTPPTWVWPERSPPELIAIAAKALAWAPADRYRDAAALAVDVSAYLDGRRVEAHAYSTAELARRLIHAWRWQVAAVVAALVAGGVVLALTGSRIKGEERRAHAAEQRATAALGDTRVALAWALEQSAVAALVAGDDALAESFAARALGYRESVDARGVLAATRAGGRPRAVAHRELPCAEVIPDDDQVAVCRDGDALVRWELAPGVARWRVPSRATRALGLGAGGVLALEPGVELVIHDDRDGHAVARMPVPPLVNGLVRDRRGRRAVAHSQRELWVFTPDAVIAPALERPCGEPTIDAVAVGVDAVFAVCGDGRVVRVDDTGVRAIATVPFERRAPASSAALDLDERTLAIGGIHGEVALLDLETATVIARRTVLPEPVRRVALVGELVAVAGERGGVRLWGRGLDTELVRLPERAGNRFALVGDELITGGAGWWRWRLPTAPVPRRFVAPAGLAAAAIDRTGDRLVAARGDGRVSVWSTRLGRLEREVVIGPGVVKHVDVSPDGARIAVAHAGHPGSVLVATVDGAVTVLDPAGGSHRVAFLADGALAVVPYARSLVWWSADGARRERVAPMVGDAEPMVDRTGLWLLARDGEIWQARGDAMTRGFAVPGAIALAPMTRGDQLVVATESTVAVRTVDGAVVTALAGPIGRVLDVAVSPDDRWIAAGTTAGAVEVWTADGRRVAHLRGHTARIAWVGFAAGALWSAGWDGVVLRWDLTALTASAATLLADADATWGPAR